MKIKGKNRAVIRNFGLCTAACVLSILTAANVHADILLGSFGRNVETMLEQMTMREKVAQLFFVTPEALTGVSGVTVAGEITAVSFAEYPVGGIIYFSQNIQSRRQLSEMLSGMQEISMERLGIPVFLGVDEEGGTVVRVGQSGVSDIPAIGDMFSIGSTGNAEEAYDIGRQIGGYLSELHFNVNFAPVADIYSNPDNTVIGSRSFGYDAATVASMVCKEVEGLQEQGVSATLKHFPGHGNTAEDSHMGFARNYCSLDELRANELIPFQEGIKVGTDFVMVGHISLPNILEDDTPASLSKTMVTNILRGELGFQGVIITDALNMGAIVYNYTSGDAAVRAIEAGADMLLMPADFQTAYEAVCLAVESGRISSERLDESVLRILKIKMEK